MYAFQLGREYKLSLAEIMAVFPMIEIIYSDTNIAIVNESRGGKSSSPTDSLEQEILSKAPMLGGTIKIMKIESLKNTSFQSLIIDKGMAHNGKFQYGISFLGGKANLKKDLLALKKSLKAEGVSSRFVNKDFKNLNTAQIMGEKLVDRGTDFTVITTNNNPSAFQAASFDKGSEESPIQYFLGTTLWIQDIYAYSKRDYSKTRDMQVGMLPPKLSQMMINLVKTHSPKPSSNFSQREKDSTIGGTIYDPFVGLGTILIEAKLMGFTGLYGSDLNETMVKTASQNNPGAVIEKLNAKFIHEATFWEKVKDGIIVSEGFLGEVMTQKNISKDRIQVQRDTLSKLYKAFFENLQKGGFSGTIVMSFPFWEIRGKYYYFEEVYSILTEYCEILELLPEDFSEKATKAGSLLYKREKQLVGREIFKLKIKKV